MQSIRPLRFAALLIAIVAGAGIAAKPAADNLDDIYTQIYSTEGLPVYRLVDGKPVFDPSAVIELIEARVRPESWNPGPASIMAYAEQKSVVISQTQAGHEQILTLWRSLRTEAKK
jgi:hypothetical protein